MVVSEGHIDDYKCECPKNHPLPSFEDIAADKFIVLMSVIAGMGGFDYQPDDIVWTGTMDTAVCLN